MCRIALIMTVIVWMHLWNNSSGTFTDDFVVTNFCKQLTKLSTEQKEFCKSDYLLFEELQRAAEYGRKFCKSVMQFDRWNCNESLLEGDRSIYYVLNDGSSKEAGFVTAIRAAAMYWGVLKGYQGKLLLPCPQGKDKWNYRVCELKAKQAVDNFIALDQLPTAQIERDVARHNAWLGAEIARNVIKSLAEMKHSIHCCTQYQMPDFIHIAEEIRRTYLTEAHRMKSYPVDRGIADYETGERPNQRWLVYIKPTPDVCRNQPSATDNKLCFTGDNRTKAEDQCNSVCCEKGCVVVRREDVEQETCKMKPGSRCCDEVCSATVTTATNYYCCNDL